MKFYLVLQVYRIILFGKNQKNIMTTITNHVLPKQSCICAYHTSHCVECL